MFLPNFRALALLASLVPLSAQAQNSDAAAYLRLHIAGDLRNETQTMARLACYIGAGFQPAAQRKTLSEVMANFAAGQQVLKDGDAAQGLMAEQDSRVLAALTELSKRWPLLSARLNLVLHGGDLTADGVAAIDTESLLLLEKADTLSNRIANVNSAALADLPLIMTLSIDMADRQIMRTEKAAKEACLIGSGVNTAQNRQSLKKTVAVFSATMNALIDGLPGMIVRAPSLEIKTLLENARTSWATPKAALVKLYTAGSLTAEDRMAIGLGLETVAHKLSDAAALYQDIQLEQ